MNHDQEIITLLREQNALLGKIMSAISDFAAQVQTNFAKIQAGITSLDSQIQAFQASASSLSPADQAILDGIVTASAQLAAAAQAPVTGAVTPTPPATDNPAPVTGAPNLSGQ